MEDGQPNVRVPVVTLSRFWRICSCDIERALNGEPITIRYLFPHEALDKETAPWPETMFNLEREHTINAKDFRFVHDVKQGLARPPR